MASRAESRPEELLAKRGGAVELLRIPAFLFGRLSGLAAGKTVSGSMAFLLSAFLITVVLMISSASLDLVSAISIGAVVAVSTCVMEAISRRGTDNLTIPLIAWAILFVALPGASS